MHGENKKGLDVINSRCQTKEAYEQVLPTRVAMVARQFQKVILLTTKIIKKSCNKCNQKKDTTNTWRENY